VLYDFRLFAIEDTPGTVLVSGESGVHLIRTHQPSTIEPISTATPVVTGHDLTKYTSGKIEFHVQDATGAHKWESIEVDIQETLRRHALGQLEASDTVFDNDFPTFDLTDAATGTFVLNDTGRALSYIRSDLFIFAQTALQRIDVFNETAGQTLTNAYVNYGDPQDELTLISDGDQIEFIYGDGTSANGLFVDGVANVGREGGIASETQIVGNQLQTRAEEGSTLSNVVRITIFRRALVNESPERLNCLPQTTVAPAAAWTLTGGVAATGENLLVGGAGQQDGVAEYEYSVPVGNRNTQHTFSFNLREVDAAGNDIALRVEVEQAGSVFVSKDLLTTEVAQNITLEFVPTADVIIRIRDTSTGSQGNNRDALVSNIQVEATCKVALLASSCFAISLPDPARTDLNVFDWNLSAQNDIRATDFYITQDTASFVPLTELVVPLGETITFYLVGPLYNTATTFDNIAGVELEASNTNGVLSFNRVDQNFSGSAASLAAWPNITYDDLDEVNNNVGDFSQAAADFLFTTVPVDLSQVASDVKQMQTASPNIIGTNPAARLEITHGTLASELGVDLANLGIQVVAGGVGILPMTSADYVQGGITAITANATNWARIGNNAPTQTNVGFENVPQGRYRYTFSIPEQEDNSTVAANDVADNDRPFPVVVVNGVVEKLHGDNTYIEHDDGSTSEYFSSGSIVVPEGGSVQLGFVIEGGQTEEFEFQNQTIETQNGADAIYGFFEIEKIDRPVVVTTQELEILVVNTASEIPNPTTVLSGTQYIVTNDPTPADSGTYLVLGPVNSNGTGILKTG